VGSHGDHAPAVMAFLVALVMAAGGARAAEQCGEAAWYPAGGRTASGEANVTGALTAAHPTLPFGTKVEVLNLANGKSVVVRINDRGRFSGGRIIDLSRAAAEKLDFIRDGVAPVRVSVLGNVPVRLKGTCTATKVASSDSGDTAGAMIADRPTADPPPISAVAMATRFSTAFQPDSWAEAELKKALEAFVPALRP
jgi:rare lipoprotein A